jgi:hypothetical protein
LLWNILLPILGSIYGVTHRVETWLLSLIELPVEIWILCVISGTIFLSSCLLVLWLAQNSWQQVKRSQKIQGSCSWYPKLLKRCFMIFFGNLLIPGDVW